MHFGVFLKQKVGITLRTKCAEESLEIGRLVCCTLDSVGVHDLRYTGSRR